MIRIIGVRTIGVWTIGVQIHEDVLVLGLRLAVVVVCAVLWVVGVVAVIV